MVGSVGYRILARRPIFFTGVEMFTFIIGFLSGVLIGRLWKPLLTWYLNKESQLKNELERK